VKFWLARMVQGFPNICYLNAFDKILVANNPLDLVNISIIYMYGSLVEWLHAMQINKLLHFFF